jgi:hypothetical protein
VHANVFRVAVSVADTEWHAFAKHIGHHNVLPVSVSDPKPKQHVLDDRPGVIVAHAVPVADAVAHPHRIKWRAQFRTEESNFL